MTFRDFRKKESFLGRMRRVGWGTASEVRKAIMVKPKAAAGGRTEETEGIFKGRPVLTERQTNRGIWKIRGITENRRKIYSYMLKRKSGKIVSGRKPGVTAKNLEALYPELVRQIGEGEADRIMKQFESDLSGGKIVGARRAVKQMRAVKNLTSYQKNLAEVMVISLVPDPSTPGMPRGTTRADIEDTAKDIEKKFGKPQAVAFKRAYGIEETSVKEAPVVGQGNVTDLNAWKRRRPAQTDETTSGRGNVTDLNAWKRRRPAQTDETTSGRGKRAA